MGKNQLVSCNFVTICPQEYLKKKLSAKKTIATIYLFPLLFPILFFSILFHKHGRTQIMSFAVERASLWMGDLEPWMDENWLRQLWLSCGYMVSVKMIRDRSTGTSAGYCFVDFASLAEATHVLSRFNGHAIPGTGRIFKLNWASGSGQQGARDLGVEYTLYVCDLPPELNDYQLFGLFQARYPSCKGARIVFDPLTHLSKGYGFVRFSDELEQHRAMLEMNNLAVGSARIRCAPAQVKLSGPSGTPTSNTTYTPKYAMNLNPTSTTPYYTQNSRNFFGQ